MHPAPALMRSTATLLAVASVALASCDSAGPESYTIPVVRIVGATIETGPGLRLRARAETREVDRVVSTCGGPTVDCASGVTVNPTRGDGTRVTFSRDVRLGDEPVLAGTDVYPLLRMDEARPFYVLSPFAIRDGTLPARLVVPDDTRITVSWTTVDGETIAASAVLEP